MLTPNCPPSKTLFSHLLQSLIFLRQMFIVFYGRRKFGNLEEKSAEIFKPSDKSFFSLLGESFKSFCFIYLLIVVPFFLVVEFLVPFLSNFIPDLAEGLTNTFLDDFLSDIFRLIIVTLIGAIIAGIAWIATIRVIASS